MQLNYLSFLFVAISLYRLSCVRAEAFDDSWMNPNGWSQQEPDCKCKCTDLTLSPTATPTNNQPMEMPETSKFTEDGVALLYLRRWLMQLFDRKKLVYDANRYRRTLSFSLTPSQLDKIEKWNDVRDLDEIITEVFTHAYENGQCFSTKKPTAFFALSRDIFIDFIQMTKISEIRFLLMALLVAAFGWFIHKKYRISYFTLIAGGLFLFGYFHTYLECNRELEVKEMLETLKSSESEKTSAFVRFYRSIFASSTANDEKMEQKLKKTAKLKLGFCRPDEVAIMYFTDIFLKYLQILLEQGAGTINILQGNLPWPLNYVAPFMLVFMVGFFLKLTFKYVLSPAVGGYVWNRNPQHYSQTPAAIGQGDGLPHNTDRLSGENLTALISLIKPAILSKAAGTVPAVSGVEVVHEAIEAAAGNDSSSSSNGNLDTSTKSPTKTKKKNNDAASKENTSLRYNDVSIEDLPDES